MANTRRYYSTRQIIDLTEFLSLKEDSYIMCVSGSMLYALRKMAKTRLMWPSTYAQERYEQTYLLPDEEEWNEVEYIVSEWIAESEVVELCNNRLIEAIEGLSDMVRLSSCCYGAGPGVQDIGGEIYYGTEEPLEEPTAFGEGEEFETEAEYEAHKCETANGIINGLIGSLNGISVLTLASLAASSLLAAIVGIGLITVPPVAIILAILGTGLTFAFFQSLANELEDYREDLVCILYNSGTAIDAYDGLKEAIEDISIDIGVIEIQVGPLLDLVMQLTPIDTMNALFESVALPSISGDTVECSACAECPGYTVISGTFDPGTGYLVAEFDGDATPDRYKADIVINATWDPTIEYCGDPVTMDCTEISGTPYDRDNNLGYRYYNQSGGIVYSHKNEPPASPVSNVGRVYLFNDQASPGPYTFTVELDWS